jgi:hypothetical protein
MLGLQEFMEEVISIDSIEPSCNELGRIIDELIEDGLFKKKKKYKYM